MIVEQLQFVQELLEKYQINLLNSIFINFTLTIVLLGLLINAIEPHLPAFITQSFRYGKHSHKGEQNALIGKLEVPKSWFSHFYVFAFGWSLLALSLNLKVLIHGTTAPDIVVDFLDFVAGGKERKVLVNSTSGFVATVLITMQCVRRFYETNFIQIFSSKSKINLSHYIVGYLHYFGCIAAVLANTEGFVRGTTPSSFSFQKITMMQFICCFMFHFSWAQQYKSNMILVNLRKDTAGNTVTEKHLMPQGGFFQFVSSPHMFFEVAMYVAISGVIPASSTWAYIVIWVIANQTENAWLTHKWYKENFKNYPKRRFAIYPYIL